MCVYLYISWDFYIYKISLPKNESVEFHFFFNLTLVGQVYYQMQQR